MDTTNMTITDKTTADLSGTISFPGSIINTTPNPYIGMVSTIGVASAMANSVGTTVTNLKNELEQRIAALESVTSYLLSKVSELENSNRCKLDPEIGAVICDL